MSNPSLTGGLVCAGSKPGAGFDACLGGKSLELVLDLPEANPTGPLTYV